MSTERVDGKLTPSAMLRLEDVQRQLSPLRDDFQRTIIGTLALGPTLKHSLVVINPIRKRLRQSPLKIIRQLLTALVMFVIRALAVAVILFLVASVVDIRTGAGMFASKDEALVLLGDGIIEDVRVHDRDILWTWFVVHLVDDADGWAAKTCNHSRKLVSFHANRDLVHQERGGPWRVSREGLARGIERAANALGDVCPARRVGAGFGDRGGGGLW